MAIYAEWSGYSFSGTVKQLDTAFLLFAQYFILKIISSTRNRWVRKHL